MEKRVTIQDIADALNLSKNTVSKALNKGDSVPPATRDKVLNKAAELNYKGYGLTGDIQLTQLNKNIMLLNKGDIFNVDFFSRIMNGVANKVSENKFNLLVSMVNESEIASIKIPPNITKDKVDGIICIEIFDIQYINALLSLGIPIVFIDFHYNYENIKGNYDVVMMENETKIYTIVNKMIYNGCKHIGFIGDYKHCRSFYERWLGFCHSLYENKIQNSNDLNILTKNAPYYQNSDWILSQLKQKHILPDAFVCANDSIAKPLAEALNKLEMHIPSDIKISGFDDDPSVASIISQITTVRIYKAEIGICAAETLFSRIKNPNKQNQIIYINTEIIN